MSDVTAGRFRIANHSMQTAATQSPSQPASPEADKAQRHFQCSTCQRSFTRADHLTRHVRAHTKSKPYICPVCSKGFARIDLLKRHVTNHDAEPASKRQKREIVRDTRVVQACDACSQSHLRCEDEKPCSRCKKKKIFCMVSEAPPSEQKSVHGIDAVHAAQDLLDLSNSLDYPSSVPAPGESVNPSTASKPLEPLSHPHSSLMANTVGPIHYSEGPENRSMNTLYSSKLPPLSNGLSPLLNELPPLSNITGGFAAGSQYYEGPSTSLSFFDNSNPNYDTTPGLPDYFRNMPPFEAFLSGQATPRGIMDFDFNHDLGLTDSDVGLLDQYNFQFPFAADILSMDTPGAGQQLPETNNTLARAEAFNQSVWSYHPQRHRDSCDAEQANLDFSDSEIDTNQRAHFTQRRVMVEKLPRVSRDRLMALVLGTCSPQNVKRIASAFPSIELLDGLIQFFLTSPSLDAQSWFHLPTFSPSKLSPEFLACVVAAGAATIPDMSLRKLGYALHEASRAGQSRIFEEDSFSIGRLQDVGNLYLQLRVGIWSGISRKTGIAESFLQPLLTMLRRHGRFRRSTWKEVSPSADERGPSLEKKWREWAHQESFLRLVHCAFELDRQISMAFLRPPLVSYSEMQLPLPSSNVLWQAKSAVAWKTEYLKIAHTATKRPSAFECFLSLKDLVQHDHAIITSIYMVWGPIWEYRQMCALTARSQTKTNDSLILPSQYQELTKILKDFRVNSALMSKSSEIALELMFVHLNAPLDDIQLFAGIEGQEEACSVYPGLQVWVETVSARQALWHAGQIMRLAESLQPTLLCNFNVIAIYHAGLVIWSYGFLKRSTSTDHNQADTSQETIILNRNDSLITHTFITLSSSIPAISSPWSQDCILLKDVCGIMDAMIRLLQGPDAAECSKIPLVGNLVHLLENLRSASK